MRYGLKLSPKLKQTNNTGLKKHTKPRSEGIRRGLGKHWDKKLPILIRDGGREVCNLKHPEGLGEYRWRIFLMWLRQDGICCNCWLELKLSDATFEHQDGRGAGRRDDRIAIFDEDGRFVRHLNGASHAWCNHKRGSRRTELWHGNNCVTERERYL